MGKEWQKEKKKWEKPVKTEKIAKKCIFFFLTLCVEIHLHRRKLSIGMG